MCYNGGMVLEKPLEIDVLGVPSPNKAVFTRELIRCLPNSGLINVGQIAADAEEQIRRETGDLDLALMRNFMHRMYKEKRADRDIVVLESACIPEVPILPFEDCYEGGEKDADRGVGVDGKKCSLARLKYTIDGNVDAGKTTSRVRARQFANEILYEMSHSMVSDMFAESVDACRKTIEDDQQKDEASRLLTAASIRGILGQEKARTRFALLHGFIGLGEFLELTRTIRGTIV